MPKNKKWEVEHEAVLVGINKEENLAKIRYLGGLPLGYKFGFMNNKIDFVEITSLLGIREIGETISITYRYHHIEGSDRIVSKRFFKESISKENIRVDLRLKK